MMTRHTTAALLSSLLLSCCVFTTKALAQGPKDFTITAYYAGGPERVDSFAAEKLTHIIHSFSHLEGARMHLRSLRDTLTIQKMVGLKQRNPHLKVLLSLGGWGGCQTCSDVFSDSANRHVFALSVKELGDYFGTDGVDLDWEYPALPSLPGHGYKPEDQHHFTLLVQELRNVLGSQKEISFAVGASKKALDQSIEWGPVMQVADRVNVMTYDFTTGPRSGHNSSLYSTAEQESSADNSIRYMLQLGVPADKIVVGAAFYAKRWDSIPPVGQGRYQTGKLAASYAYKDLDSALPEAEGYTRYWDTAAHAPYLYNPRLQQYVTYEDVRAVKEKTQYARQKGLNGIMFWQLAQDKLSGGLLDAIYEEKAPAPSKRKQKHKRHTKAG